MGHPNRIELTRAGLLVYLANHYTTRVMVNEVSKRKSTLRIKLKAASQEEQIQMWKEHFKNLLGNYPKVTDKSIRKIINS